jgi:flagellar basal-body rod protein FlgB
LFLFSLASQHAAWLTARQATTAVNIANADTPGFQAVDIAPFEQVMERTKLGLAMTNPGHMSLAGLAAGDAGTQTSDHWDKTASGNSVTLEAELLKLGETSRQFALDTSLMRSFHRMVLASLKA